MSQGKMDRALDYFERSIPWTPNYAALEINLGIANGSLHPAAAEPHFLRAIQLAPQEATGQNFYARWLQQNGRSVEALNHLRIALAANPDHLLSHYLMMESSASLRDWPQVKTEALATLQLFPSDSTAMRYLAAPNAPQLPLPGRSADDYLNLSLRDYRVGNHQRSLEAAREALQLRSCYAEAYNNIAAAYAALGQWDPAIDAASQAVRIRPGFQLARNNLLWSETQKKKQQGRTILRASDSKTITGDSTLRASVPLDERSR